MRKITKRQFDAYCYSRQPQIRMVSDEVSWFEAFDRKILATITIDKIDKDFGFVILGRDIRRLFRCIEVGADFWPTIEEAEKNLIRAVEKYGDDGNETYPQGDEVIPPNDLFDLIVEEERLHQYFKVLCNEPRFEAARNLVQEIVYSYENPDENYIREFQSNGFDSRLWELYLYVYLYDDGFEFIQGHPSPDFHVSRLGEEFLIEAVTVNASQNVERPDAKPPESLEELKELTDGYLPIKFGSPLFSKLNRRYWELEHVQGKPLIIAIHDYHLPGSMTWSRTALSEYLYGKKAEFVDGEDGVRSPEITVILEHSWEGKTIPSNFFGSQDAENISAVIFSNAATITKFNRMGKLAGLGSAEFKMIREGVMFDPDPSATEPKQFRVDVDDPEYEESWSDSIVMYHNRNAIHPISIHQFPSISHIWFDDEVGEFQGFHQPYDVLASVTVTIVGKDDRPETNSE